MRNKCLKAVHITIGTIVIVALTFSGNGIFTGLYWVVMLAIISISLSAYFIGYNDASDDIYNPPNNQNQADALTDKI